LFLRKEPAVCGIGPVNGLLDSKGKIGAVLVAFQPLVDVGLFNRLIEKLEKLP
jgi:hypothetical protein